MRCRTSSSNQADVDALISGPVRQSELAGELNSTLWEAHAKLYRLAATAANEKDDKKIQAAIKEASAAAAKIPGALKAVEAAADPTTVKPDVLTKLKTAVAGYLKQSKSAIEMADGDPGSAMMFIKGAERHFTDDRQTHRRRDRWRAARAAIARSRAPESSSSSSNRCCWPSAGRAGADRRRGVVRDRPRHFPTGGGDVAGDARTGGRQFRRPACPGLDRRDEVGQMAQRGRGVQAAGAGQGRARRRRARTEESRGGGSPARSNCISSPTASRRRSARSSRTSARRPANWKVRPSCWPSRSDETQKLSTVVTAASEETSGNVQSVAEATEQMVASVNEIGSQVQLSARITHRGGRAGGEDRRADRQAGAGREPDRRRHRDDHHDRRRRPICWRSTPPSKPPAPAKPGAALRWSRRK